MCVLYGLSLHRNDLENSGDYAVIVRYSSSQSKNYFERKRASCKFGAHKKRIVPKWWKNNTSLCRQHAHTVVALSICIGNTFHCNVQFTFVVEPVPLIRPVTLGSPFGSFQFLCTINANTLSARFCVFGCNFLSLLLPLLLLLLLLLLYYCISFLFCLHFM